MYCKFSSRPPVGGTVHSVLAILLAQLATFGDWGKKIADTLNNKDIKTTVSYDDTGRVAKVHIHCHVDAALIRLANAIGIGLSFPRGFAILVDLESKTILGINGFYPKFRNDDRAAATITSSFKGVKRMTAFLKYSGSLGIFGIFQHPTKGLCWTASSKNSATNEYSEMNAAMVMDMMTPEFLQKWWDSGVHTFCAEVMYNSDQSHGYRTTSGFIVTCAHRGLEFLAATDLFDWCTSLGLPTDKPISIEGEEKILTFLSEMEKVRDYLTLNLLVEILANLGYTYDIANHSRLVLSQIVEGFVISTDRGTVKYKFPFYQVVTQFLRPLMKNGRNDLTVDDPTAPLKDNALLAHQTAYFLNTWVVSQCLNIRGFWMMLLKELVEEDSAISPTAGIGKWITVAENVISRHVLHLRDTQYDFSPYRLQLVKRKAVLVVGPIGSGKSSIGRQLESLHPDIVHVDGDGPWNKLPRAIVLSLKALRNLYTCAYIISKIIAGKIPVVSAGGGALWFGTMGDAHEIPFIVRIAQAYGIELELVVIHPSDLNVYDDEAADKRVADCIADRIKRNDGIWNIPIQKLQELSRKNRQIAEMFIDFAAKMGYQTLTYEMCSHETAHEQTFALDVTPQEPLTEVTAMMFQQWATCTLVKPEFPDELEAHFKKSYTGPEANWPNAWKKMCTGKANGFTGANASKLHHATLFYNGETKKTKVPKPLCADGTKLEGEMVFFFDPKDVTQVCSIVKLPFSDSAHLTVSQGMYKPAEMKKMAVAYTTNSHTLELETTEGTMKRVTVDWWTQPVTVTMHGMVAL